MLSLRTLISLFAFLMALQVAVAETPSAKVGKVDLLSFVDVTGKLKRVKTKEDWGRVKENISQKMQLVMGALPADAKKVPFAMEILEVDEFPGYTRKRITFAVEAGDRLPAYLLIPKQQLGPAPAMLCLHPTSEHGKGQVVGLGDESGRNYAGELANRGFVTLAPDYPGFGDYEDLDAYAMGYASATMKGIWNHMRCVDLLQSLAEVDPKRIGAIGHSLGGHNAMFVVFFDERIKVVVSSCGFNTFAKYYHGDLTGWSHKGYMPRIAEIYGKDPVRMPFDWPEVLAGIAPRAVFINAPVSDLNFEVSGVVDCVEAANPVYALFNAKEKLHAQYPDCEHDFPEDIREKAYAFVEEALSK